MARITVRDLLQSNGLLRKEVMLRAAITKGGNPRNSYWTHPKLRFAITRYIQDRQEREIGLSGSPEYAGLFPDQPFVLATQHSGYSLVRKHRVLATGQIEQYLAADGLEARFRDIYDSAGLKACSSHSGRRTLASALLAKGVASDDVSIILGHSDPDHTVPYLQCSDAMLEAAFAEVF